MFITDYGATSHMVNLEENMKNFKDEKTQVTVEDSKTLTRKKCGNWHGWQKCDENLHCTTLTNTDLITGLHEKTLSIMQELQKVSK